MLIHETNESHIFIFSYCFVNSTEAVFVMQPTLQLLFNVFRLGN